MVKYKKSQGVKKMDGKDKIREYYHSFREFAGEQKRKIENVIQKEKDLRKLDDVVKTNNEKSESEISRLWDVIEKMDIQINVLENKVMKLEQRLEEAEKNEK